LLMETCITSILLRLEHLCLPVLWLSTCMCACVQTTDEGDSKIVLTPFVSVSGFALHSKGEKTSRTHNTTEVLLNGRRAMLLSRPLTHLRIAGCAKIVAPVSTIPSHRLHHRTARKQTRKNTKAKESAREREYEREKSTSERERERESAHAPESMCVCVCMHVYV